MKAAVYTKTGAATVLEIKEIKPTPEKDEVLVALRFGKPADVSDAWLA